MSTTTVQAYAAKEAGASLVSYSYETGKLRPYDVEIDVLHCGICICINIKW